MDATQTLHAALQKFSSETDAQNVAPGTVHQVLTLTQTSMAQAMSLKQVFRECHTGTMPYNYNTWRPRRSNQRLDHASGHVNSLQEKIRKRLDRSCQGEKQYPVFFFPNVLLTSLPEAQNIRIFLRKLNRSDLGEKKSHNCARKKGICTKKLAAHSS